MSLILELGESSIMKGEEALVGRASDKEGVVECMCACIKYEINNGGKSPRDVVGMVEIS